MRASGVSPCSFTARSLASTSAAAPSQMPLALPAVTVPPPSFLKTGGSLANASSVVPGRGCSSTVNSSGALPLLPLLLVGAPGPVGAVEGVSDERW